MQCQDAVRTICKEVDALVKMCGKPKMLDAIALPPPELYKHVEVCDYLSLVNLTTSTVLLLPAYFVLLLDFSQPYHNPHNHKQEQLQIILTLQCFYNGYIYGLEVVVKH